MGYGAAGSCAAIEAHDHGANVLILEVASSFGGTTVLSDCQVYWAAALVFRGLCVQDSPTDMYRYLLSSQGERADEKNKGLH